MTIDPETVFCALTYTIHTLAGESFGIARRKEVFLGREILRVGIDVYSYRTGLHNLQWWISLPYSTLDGQTAVDLLASSHYQLEDL